MITVRKGNIMICLKQLSFFTKFKNNYSSKSSFLTLLSLLCTLATSTISATETPATQDIKDHLLLRFNPEIGIDFGATKMKFADDKTVAKIFDNTLTPVNVFMGVNFTEHWGLELGYSYAKKNKKNVMFAVGENIPGYGEPTEYTEKYNFFLSRSQPYLSINYKHYIGNKIQLFGSVGIAYMNLETSWTLSELDGDNALSQAIISAKSKNYIIKKSIPLLRVGMYCPLNKLFSLRFITAWTNTAKLQKLVPSHTKNGISNRIHVKNNLQYSIGLVCSI